MSSADPLVTRSFVVAFAANLLQGLSFFLFIHLPSYLTDLGASESEVGVLVVWRGWAAIAVRPLLGRVMDTRGRIPVILVGGVLNTLVALLYLTVSVIGPWLFAVRIIHGFAMGMVFTSLFAYGADVVPIARRTEGLALFGVSGLLPIALGGVIGDIVLARSDFTAVFVASAVFAGLGTMISVGLREQAELLPDGESHGGFLRAVWRPPLLPIWGITAAFATALTGYFVFLRTFVDATGIGSVGLFFSFYAGTAIALRIGFAWLPERVGRKRVLFPAFGALIAGFFVLAQASSGVDVALSGVLCGGGHAYAFPILMGFMVDRASPSGRGSAVAFFTALFDVGVLVGGPLLGAVIELSGYPAMFTTAGLLLTVAVAVFAAWDRRWDSLSRPKVAARE